MRITTIFPVILALAVTLSTSSPLFSASFARGPIPFSAWDTDGSGTIDQQEFQAMRQQRQEAIRASGRLGRNMRSAPDFSTIDSDGDGVITPDELAAYQQKRRQGNSVRKGRGMGPGAMFVPGGGLDEETRNRYTAFFQDTLELRKEIAAKRAEKMAIMRSADPDPEQAANVTRELVELRNRLWTKAREAGISVTGRGMGMGTPCGRVF